MAEPSCPGDCPGCSSNPDRKPQTLTPQQVNDDSLLRGGPLALAAGYVFALPLAVLIAAQFALASRLGEWGALGVGVGAATILMIPAILHLRVRRRGKEEAA